MPRDFHASKVEVYYSRIFHMGNGVSQLYLSALNCKHGKVEESEGCTSGQELKEVAVRGPAILPGRHEQTKENQQTLCLVAVHLVACASVVGS